MRLHTQNINASNYFHVVLFLSITKKSVNHPQLTTKLSFPQWGLYQEVACTRNIVGH